MTVSFVSPGGVLDVSPVSDRDIVVPSGTALMVVAVISTDVTTRTGATFNGTALSAATTANSYVAIFYRLAPTAGTFALTVSPNTNMGSCSVGMYATTTTGFSFQGAQQASTGSASYSPSGAAAIVHAISCTNATGTVTPVASTTERQDNAGNWYGDRFVTGSGAVTVGASNATDPDYAGGIWLEVTGGASLTATASFTSAAATAAATATLGHPASASFTSGAATAAATAVLGHPASASFASASATASATATVVGNKTATASFASAPATSAASATVSGNKTATASFTAAAASMTASAVFARTATAGFQAGSASWSASAAIAGNKTITASFQAGAAGFSASLSIPDPGSGEGPSAVTVPAGGASVTVPGGESLARISRGRATVEVE